MNEATQKTITELLIDRGFTTITKVKNNEDLTIAYNPITHDKTYV